MKTIGLIGGTSWESSRECDRITNEKTRAELGCTRPKSCCIRLTLPRSSIFGVPATGARRRVVQAAQSLEKGGAGLLLICTNTMHRIADDVQNGVSIPLLHIADPTGEAIKAAGVTRIGLLGTGFTMEHDFYKGRMSEEFGLEVVVADEWGRESVHDVVYDELCPGEVKQSSREKCQGIVRKPGEQGAQGVVLGCTETGLPVHQEDTPLPVFDTTGTHAEAAVTKALKERRLSC